MLSAVMLFVIMLSVIRQIEVILIVNILSVLLIVIMQSFIMLMLSVITSSFIIHNSIILSVIKLRDITLTVVVLVSFC